MIELMLEANKGSFRKISGYIGGSQLQKKTSVRGHLLNNVKEGNADLDLGEDCQYLVNIRIGSL